jgi:alkyl hydroperoxide reductase subunit AhpC
MVDDGVPFPTLSNGPGHVGSLFGVYDEAAGVEMRGRFLIDPHGMVQATEIPTLPVGRNVSELIRQICAYRHVRIRRL